MPPGRKKKAKVAATAATNGSADGSSPAAAEGPAEAGSITKMEAVRRALGELGWDALPAQLQAHVKSRFGLYMTPAHVSTYKSALARKAAKAGRRRGPGRPKGPAAAKAGSNSTGGGRGQIAVEDVRSVKALADRLGPDRLRELVDVLS